MARGLSREQSKEKNAKASAAANKGNQEGISATQRAERDAQKLREKQALNEAKKKEMLASLRGKHKSDLTAAREETRACFAAGRSLDARFRRPRRDENGSAAIPLVEKGVAVAGATPQLRRAIAAAAPSTGRCGHATRGKKTKIAISRKENHKNRRKCA